MVIGIPGSEPGAMRAAKVLFCSKRYRDVILIAFSDRLSGAQKNVEFVPAEFNGQRAYTAAQIIRSGRWPVLGHCALTELEKNASLRIVAGDVWLQDERLRPATAHDLDSIPAMDMAGAALVEKWAIQ
jgi:hypothetical protein